LTSISNPKSIILSASSKIIHVHYSKTKYFFIKESFILPGVPINVSIPFFKCKAYSSSLLPPTITNERNPVPNDNF